ncbi:MAG: hypothetical protein ACJAS9_003508 [Polaribacter sp.]|jgi:hypothetical protein
MKNKFLTNIKVLSASVVLAMTVVGSASAASISVGNSSNLNGVAQLATDNSGLTSVNVPSSNLTDGSGGFFVETFDQATQTLAPGQAPGGTVQFPVGDITFNEGNDSSGCAVNGTGAGIKITESVVGASFGVRKGTQNGVAAAPLADETCFGYTPSEGGTVPSWVEVDYEDFLLANGDVGITFLGFYWGSVDVYNDFTFYNIDGAEIDTITGSQLLTEAGGTSGDRDDPESNLYVAIDFDFADAFTKLRVTSNGIAGEFDNIVIGLKNRDIVPVPAPSGVALLGLGLLGLGLRKRLRK